MIEVELVKQKCAKEIQKLRNAKAAAIRYKYWQIRDHAEHC